MSPLHCVMDLEDFNVDFCSFFIINNEIHRGSIFDTKRRMKKVTESYVLRQNEGKKRLHIT